MGSESTKFLSSWNVGFFSVTVRLVETMPAVALALAAAVKVEAPDHIPMPIGEAILDWRSLGTVESSSGPRPRVVGGYEPLDSAGAALQLAVDRVGGGKLYVAGGDKGKGLVYHPRAGAPLDTPRFRGRVRKDVTLTPAAPHFPDPRPPKPVLYRHDPRAGLAVSCHERTPRGGRKTPRTT